MKMDIILCPTLRFDLNLALRFDNSGYSSLHLAAMNGDLAILEEFVTLAPASFQFLTTNIETVFHLVARFNHYNAFIYLIRVFCDTYLFHQPDKFGNTILHLAISRGHYQLRKSLIEPKWKLIIGIMKDIRLLTSSTKLRALQKFIILKTK